MVPLPAELQSSIEESEHWRSLQTGRDVQRLQSSIEESEHVNTNNPLEGLTTLQSSIEESEQLKAEINGLKAANGYNRP